MNETLQEYKPVSNDELANCTFMKTVLMLLVVLQHSMQFWNGGWFTVCEPAQEGVLGLQLLSQWLYHFHIYGFVLVSGYLFSYLKYERGKYSNFKQFVNNKFLRLIIPALIFTWIWVMPITNSFFHYSWVKIIQKYLFAVSPGQLWFLWMLFSVFVIFWIFSDMFYKHNLLGVVFVLIMYIAGTVAKVFVSDVFQFFTSLQCITFFWIGFKIRQCGSKYVLKIPIFIYVLTDAGLFLFFFFMPENTILFKILKIVIVYLLHIIGSVMSFAILQKIAGIINWQENKIIVYLSRVSMPIYLLHQQIIYISIFYLNGRMNPYLHTTVNFFFALTCSCIIGNLLIKVRSLTNSKRH